MSKICEIIEKTYTSTADGICHRFAETTEKTQQLMIVIFDWQYNWLH